MGYFDLFEFLFYTFNALTKFTSAILRFAWRVGLDVSLRTLCWARLSGSSLFDRLPFSAVFRHYHAIDSGKFWLIARAWWTLCCTSFRPFSSFSTLSFWEGMSYCGTAVLFRKHKEKKQFWFLHLNSRLHYKLIRRVATVTAFLWGTSNRIRRLLLTITIFSTTYIFLKVIIVTLLSHLKNHLLMNSVLIYVFAQNSVVLETFLLKNCRCESKVIANLQPELDRNKVRTEYVNYETFS